MSIKEIQSRIDDYHYWDARVISLNCGCFADEIELIYDDNDSVIVYKFDGCYKSLFEHEKIYDKDRPAKEMSFAQIPYFLQDVKVGEVSEQDIHFYTCKINMWPLTLEVWCKNIKITKQKKK
ncbi:MAG: hypothetical protein LBB56_00610 [Chitinispirillales bacterium]|jgi:hypothetical protein|nr:hypothetical protein [Chitinispirillales bacterium]